MQVFGYETDSDDPTCAAIIRPEMQYLEKVRRQQLTRVIKMLKSDPKLAQDLGPGGISIQPKDMAQVRNIIEKFLARS